MKALDYLASLQRFGVRLGLERITRLLDQLDNPQGNFKSVHIAGTNGKGSVAAMLASVLRAAGYRTGLYTSPHIFSYRERVKINTKDIPQGDFEKIIQKVRKLADGMEDRPTLFEVLTVAALAYFARKKVQIAVLEAGLGGRFDATNVVDPLISVITQIASDHTEVLGQDLEKIAFEKAGIIKPRRDIVVGSLPASALAVIRRIAKQERAPLFFASANKVKLLKQSLKGQGLIFGPTKLFLPLLGRHQIDNLALVLKIVERLKKQGFEISKERLQKGIKKVVWPLRFQVFSRNPLIILDVAHNLSGIKALIQTLKQLNPGLPVVFYVGILKRKNYQAMLRELSPVSDGFFVGDFMYPGAVCPSALLKIVPGKKLPISQSLPVFKKRFKGHLICVTGSIYFVSEFLKNC